jgi:single-stranded-DNA-specific exonuclease
VERFEPIGAANPGPTFISRNVHVRSAEYVRGGHIKMRLAQGMARRKGIAFRPQFGPPPRGSLVDLLYTVERSVWGGEERVELIVRDVQPARIP